MKITFQKVPPPTGLAGVGAGPHRSSKIKIDGTEVGRVYPIGGDWRGPLRGWYFGLRAEALGVPYMNTCDSPSATEEAAKAAAKAWILLHAAKAKVTR